MLHKPKSAVGYRGAARAGTDSLAKTTVTLPKALITDTDLAVIDRKRSEPSFNRSALVEEALRAWLARNAKRTAGGA